MTDFWQTQMFYPFHANVPFLYSLNTSENLCFSEVFRGYRNGTLAWNGLKLSCYFVFGSTNNFVAFHKKIRFSEFWNCEAMFTF